MAHNDSVTSYELTFGHGHRVSYKDLTDQVALAALSAELVAQEQIRIGDVGNTELAQAINALLQKVNTIMTDLTALQQADTDIKAAVAAAGTVLNDLAARVAAIPVASPDQQPEVDSIASDLESTATALNNAASSATAEATPPVAAPVTQVTGDGTVVPPIEVGSVQPGEPVPTGDPAPVADPAPLDGGTVPAGPGADPVAPAADTTAAPDAGSVAAPDAPADTPAAPADPAPADPAAPAAGDAPQA